MMFVACPVCDAFEICLTVFQRVPVYYSVIATSRNVTISPTIAET
jgi:hypothetical protein